MIVSYLKKYASLIGGFFLAVISALTFGYFKGRKSGNGKAKKAEAKVEAVIEQQVEAQQNEVEFREDIKEAKQSAEEAVANDNREDSDNSFTDSNW